MTPAESPLPPIAKLRDLPAAVQARDALAATGRKLVLTNGCFDLLHPGHVLFLQQAAALGDALFVAINSDASVRALKGPQRPIQTQLERATMLAALACTHTLLFFEQPRLVAEIRAVRPDVYVKAGDYTLDTLDRSEYAALVEVKAEVRILPYLSSFSTTSLLNRIVAAGRIE